MELNKSVSNPMLVGAMQLIKADGKEPDPAHQKMFMEELDKAVLLAPVEMTEGEEEGKAMVRFPILTGGDGKQFFVLFTDNAALESSQNSESGKAIPESFSEKTAAVRFLEMARVLLSKGPDGQDNPVFGIVINAFMENIIIPKTAVQGMVLKKGQEAAKAREDKKD